MAEVTLHGSTALSGLSITQPASVVSEADACAWDCAVTGVSLLGVRLYVLDGSGAIGTTVTLAALQPGVVESALGTTTAAASGTVTLAAGWNEVRFGTPLALAVGRFQTVVRNSAAASACWRFYVSDATNRPVTGTTVGSSGVSLASNAADSGKVPTQRRGRASTTDGTTWTTNSLNDSPLDVILSVPDDVTGISAAMSAAAVGTSATVEPTPPAEVAAAVTLSSPTMSAAVTPTAPGDLAATIAVAAPTAAATVSDPGAAAVAATLTLAAPTLVGSVVESAGGLTLGSIVCTTRRLIAASGELVGVTSGWVTVESLADSVRVGGALVVADRVRCRIVDGHLVAPDGSSSLVVLATDQPDASPAVVQYRARWDLDGVRTQPPTAVFEVPAGGTVDLATVVPAAASPQVERVVVDPQAVIDAAVAESTTAAEAAAQEVVLDLAPVLSVNGIEPDADGSVTIPTGATGLDARGLPVPRVERFDVVVLGDLVVGSVITRVILPAGRLKRLEARRSSSTGNALASVQVTIGQAALWASPRALDLTRSEDATVPDGSSLGVQVTSVTGTGVVTDLILSAWVLVQ